VPGRSLEQMDNLILTGFMGTGKTSIGRAVAQRLDRPFVDMDALIEERTEQSIRRLFQEQGEAAFRRLEADLCRELAQQRGLVIATGGGALVDPANRVALSRSGVVICLTAALDEILARVGTGDERPLVAGSDPRAGIERLLQARKAAYAAIPWQIDTTARTHEEVIEQVITLASTRTLHVAHPDGGYDIHIGQGTLPYLAGALIAAAIPPGARVAIVSNEVVAPLYAERVSNTLTHGGFSPFVCCLPDGEEHKRLEPVHALYDQFLAGDLDRGGVVLALGGGVVGDMAGFAAATFMRGVRLVQVPTSLLAMTDASVGAKTGVDLPQGKNLVGAFKQPELVFVDLAVLRTLSEAEVRSGLAEVIKHGIIGDVELFAALSRTLAAGHAEVTPEVLARSIRVKIDVVEEDPYERGRRAVLNLGHTLGHALERLSDYRMRHGEAVAIGMVVAARLSEALGRSEAGMVERIEGVLVDAGLPVRCPNWMPRMIWDAMRHDKKRQGRALRWILPEAIGRVEMVDDVPEDLVRSVLIEMGAEA
jgi:shikimate kinase / 3-dehydroquinate synthase